MFPRILSGGADAAGRHAIWRRRRSKARRAAAVTVPRACRTSRMRSRRGRRPTVRSTVPAAPATCTRPVEPTAIGTAPTCRQDPQGKMICTAIPGGRRSVHVRSASGAARAAARPSCTGCDGSAPVVLRTPLPIRWSGAVAVGCMRRRQGGRPRRIAPQREAPLAIPVPPAVRGHEPPSPLRYGGAGHPSSRGPRAHEQHALVLAIAPGSLRRTDRTPFAGTSLH